MHVTLQSTQAAHSGRYGVLVNVAKRFDQDWHAQVSLKGFTPPDTEHGYVFSFWGRAAADHPGSHPLPKVRACTTHHTAAAAAAAAALKTYTA